MKNKKLVIAAIAVLVVIALMAGIWFATRPETEAGSKGYAVTVVHKDSTVKEFSYRTDAEFLDDALLAEGLIAGEDGPYGLTIITVDGEGAVWDTDNAYWSILVDGEYATTGISEIPVYDGSSFTLEYTGLG